MKNTYAKWKLLIVFLIVSVGSRAQQPELVADVNDILSATVQDITIMCEAGGYIFFGHTSTSEEELGVWDGSNFMSFDLDPNGQSFVENFTAFGSDVYFTADGGGSIGKELWKFDGTSVTIIEINPTSDSEPEDLIVFQSELYFSADDGTNGRELWKYNGTNATLIDIVDGAMGSNPQHMTVYGDELVFFADNGSDGSELFRYKDMSANLVMDIRDGAIGSVGSGGPSFEEHNGSLFFAANDGGGIQLWEYNGTDVTETNVLTTGGGSSPRFLTSFNSDLYFSAVGDGGNGQELWRYNAGTPTLVQDINPGSSSSNIKPETKDSKFAVLNGTMYLVAEDGTNGEELFKFDGTTLTRIDVNQTTDLGGDAFIGHIGIANDKLYFQGFGGDESGTELWEYDGSSLTQFEINSEPEQGSSARFPAELNGTLYFTAFNGDGTDRWHLWRLNGSNPEPIDLTGETGSSNPNQFQAIEDMLYFSASTDKLGRELWVTDGTGAELLIDIVEGSDDGDPYNITAIGTELFFFGNEGDGSILYVYDGNDFSTFDLRADEGENQFIEFNDQVYFQGNDGVDGDELWVYDGEEVSLVQDINPFFGSSPTNFFVFQDELFFAANDGTNGEELWKFDGATASIVQNINPNENPSSPNNFVSIGSTLYFVATTADEGKELAKYNGSTVTIIDVREGSGGSNPEELMEFNGNLIFRAAGDASLTELWMYDGTNLIQIGEDNSDPEYLTEFNEVLYFRARDSEKGIELLQFDGTEVTVTADINTGNNSSFPSGLFVLGPYLYFNATPDFNPEMEARGSEAPLDDSSDGLRRFDGTNVELVSEKLIEVDDDQAFVAFVGDFAYFASDDEITGSELYRIRRTSEETDITAFSFTEQTGNATIDADNHTVSLEVAFGTDLGDLAPTIEVSDFATISPTSETSRDFSDVVTYTVTAEFGNTQEWTVEVTTADNNAPTVANSISDQTFDGGFESTTIDLTDVFTDADGDALVFNATSGDTKVVTVTISGTSLIITEVASGNAAVTVTANDGKGGTVAIAFNVTVNSPVTGVEDDLESLIKVYPNPASDHLKIDVPKGDWILQVFDPSGKLLNLEPQISAPLEVNTNSWLQGIHYIRLFNEDYFTTTKVLIR